MQGLVQLFKFIFTICTLHWRMGLFAYEMVQIENLYSDWNYDVMYTLAFPLKAGGGVCVQKVSSS